MGEELKPCPNPWCRDNTPKLSQRGGHLYYVMCTGCGIKSDYEHTETMAVATWNARADLRLEWRDGPPPKPWSEEWFIAETIYGDRVVLTALPAEYSYDFKTADETYMRSQNIKRWMQFPDSQYIAPTPSSKPHGETL